MPVAEVRVDVALVRRLLRAQYPGPTAHLPLVEVARGWDNAMLRLGDDLAVRLPLRAVSAPLVEHEAAWLPLLAAGLPSGVAAPVPVFRGRPGAGYPWSWNVVPWLAGQVLAAVPVGERTAYARPLAAALVALHRPAPPQAPANPWRGVPLAERAREVPPDLTLAQRAFGGAVAAGVEHAWRDGLAAPTWPGPPLWLHGDPHPHNVLVRDGRLAALVDFGDVTAGDPASDLATAWLTFDAAGRAAFRHRVDA
ncbi:MAG TPA: aminoglycoside phosphotransferase family protein, partial [Dermatophilaceae bacterium]|nr:aminoglycoside phosphotransferase family protein [Dermatophilaceae bacterium]